MFRSMLQHGYVGAAQVTQPQPVTQHPEAPPLPSWPQGQPVPLVPVAPTGPAAPPALAPRISSGALLAIGVAGAFAALALGVALGRAS